MQVVSASSLTTLRLHTAANNSCFVTGSPACAMSMARTAAAFGVSLISPSSAQSRAVGGSNRKRPKLRCLFIADSWREVAEFKSRRNPGICPGLGRGSCLLFLSQSRRRDKPRERADYPVGFPFARRVSAGGVPAKQPLTRRALAMKRFSIFAYGVVCYAVFFATFLYAIGFLGNFLVPKSIDSARDTSLLSALLIDLALLALFAVQHSVMARPAFKRWWTRIVPESAERSTYTLFSSLALIALFAYWQPMGGVVWSVASPVAQAALYGAFAFGWVLLLFSTFLINHFDLFGLRQVWLQLVGKPYRPLPFKTPVLYRYMRHPLYVGWLFIFWSTPTMTVAHLVFAIATSAYILIAIRFEERDLVVMHPEYEEYRRRVPMLVPLLKRDQAVAARAPARS